MRHKLVFLLKNLNWPILFFWACNMGASALNWVFNLILVRVLSLAEFGLISFLITIQMIMSVFAVGTQVTVNKFGAEYFSKSGTKPMFMSLLRWSWVAGFAIGGLVMVFRQQFMEAFQIPTTSQFTLLAGLMLLVLFPLGWLRGLINARQAYVLNGVLTMFESLVKVGLAYLSQFTVAPLQISSAAVTGSLAITLLLGFHIIQHWKLPKLSTRPWFVPTEVRKFYVHSAVWSIGLILPFTIDLLLVKHFFSPEESGLYAKAALVGKIIYFVNQIIIGLSVPVLSAQVASGNLNQKILPLLVALTSGITVMAWLSFYFFPELSLRILVGEGYAEVQTLAMRYTLAVGCLSVAATFATYHLVMQHYVFPLLSLIAVVFEVLLIGLFHESLLQVVNSLLGISLVLAASMAVLHQRIGKVKKIPGT